jgi:glycine/D-amino acid oxidase-like deaminating enzyme
MMQIDYLIIGQGICGTMLSWFLHKEGKSFIVIDDAKNDTSSKVAAGIINPVTGRRYVTTWMIEELIEFARQTYDEMGRLLDDQFIVEKSIIDFFPTAQMRNAFVERVTEENIFLHSYPDQNHFNDTFNYDFGCGEIKPALIVHLQLLLPLWRKKLEEKNVLLSEEFNIQELKISGGSVRYKDIEAEKVIFCNGVWGTDNPWFRLLPFAPNKGEALIIECNEIEHNHIFKKGLTLAPLREINQYWVGSSYQWEFADDQPTQQFYDHATGVLNAWLKKPYKVLSHKAAVRPATIERRPFVGFHPQFPQIGILNGMGTKGTSLAPYFAHQLTQYLVYDFPISEEADVKRFTRILSRI